MYSLILWTQTLTSLAPSRSIALPSEIVELVLLSLSVDEPSLNTADSRDWTRLLYARLELKWEAGPAESLLRTFEENPRLCQLVRGVVTVFTNSDHWDEEWYESSERDVALKEADLLFPACMDEWSEGRNHKDHEAYVANQLPNLRILCMTSMDMPIRASLLRKLGPFLAQLTTSPPREQRTGQLKYMRADVADLAVLGLNFTTLVGLELQSIGEVDLFAFTHNLFPTLVNLELLAIRGVIWNDPFSDDTLQYFCKSLSRTKLSQLYLPHTPTSRQLGHLPPTIEALGLDCRLCPFEDTTPASPAPSRAITRLPIETIERILILSLPRVKSTLIADEMKRWKECHAGLRAASLVGRRWRAAAQRLLYGRLELKWEAGTAAKLLRTFEENPDLCELVNAVSTVFISVEHWDSEWYWSTERDVALKEADSLFPACMDEWSEGRNHKDHEAYVANRALHAAVKGSNAFWGCIAKLPNLRTLSMASADMPIPDPLLETLAPVLAQLTEVSLIEYWSNDDHALSIFHLLHSVKIVRISGERDPERPSKQPRRRAQHPGQLKFLSVPGEDIALLGLDFTSLIRLDIRYIREEDLLDLSREFFPSLVNLELLFIGDCISASPVGPAGRFTSETFESFFKSLSNTKLSELHIDNWPTEAFGKAYGQGAGAQGDVFYAGSL
ncbi:hypothetical protein RQP46_001819 [Phenoliferia psychrophenolica]